MRLRHLVGSVILLLVRILNKSNLLPGLVRKLKKWKNKISPILYDDDEFLSYVKHKKLAFEANLSSIKVLALRGSTADYGFYSPGWENSFNLGLTSGDLNNAFLIYQRYREKLINLNTLILYYSVPSNGYSLLHIIERYRAVVYNYYFGIPYSYPNQINSKFEKKIINKCKKLNGISLNGYMGYEKKLQFGDNISAETRAYSHIRENKRIPDQLEWLNKLAQLVNSDNKTLVVVFPPFRSDYRKLLPPFDDLFHKVLKLKQVQFLNFYDSTIFSDTDFGDVDHLNENGAIKLTQKIKEELKIRNLVE